MDVTVAGAGSGKTTEIAKKIIQKHSLLQGNEHIFCLAFTNNAVNCINKKLLEHFGALPTNIIVSTIHSFLYKEIIKPYYYLLYGKHFERIGTCKLPEDNRYKNIKIKDLENNHIIHQSVFSERAKWIICRKSGDTKIIQAKRLLILEALKKYIGAIYIDEVQDIDKNMLEIIKKLDEIGVFISVLGDPKQDLRGFKNLNKLIELYRNSTTFKNFCYRCPEIHLNLSNKIVNIEEKQISNKINGNIFLYFESEIEFGQLVKNNLYDLCYISKKTCQFDTNKHNKGDVFENIYEEIKFVMKLRYKTLDGSEKEKIDCTSFILSKRLIMYYNAGYSRKEAMNKVFSNIDLSKSEYAKIINSIPEKELIDNKKYYVESIDSIKGKEGKNCLFILTNDLAAYLIGAENSCNKTKNKLYVALTRSLCNLTIYVLKDVEDKYGKDSFDFIVK